MNLSIIKSLVAAQSPEESSDVEALIGALCCIKPFCELCESDQEPGQRIIQDFLFKE